MSTPLRLLLVEDSEDDAWLLVRELKRSGYSPKAHRVDTPEALASALTDGAWELVLCDYTLPKLDAPAALRMVRDSGVDIPFIIVSGTIGEERAVESMRAGAHDFVLKDRLARLGPAVARELNEARHRKEQRAMREQLRQSELTLARTERLRSLGQMAAGITHDLKNLLAPLSLHLTVLDRSLRGSTTNPDVQSSIVEMKQLIDRGVRTIDRLRNFSRQDPERRAQLIDMNRIAQDATAVARPRMASSGRALSVIKEELVAPPRVWAQPDEVLAAVVNLIVNAIDAMPDGGTIVVRTGEDQGGAFIEVTDDGPGMTPEVEQRVFDPFFSTKGAEGTGLGLAMVYACVMRHSGTVSLTTSPGQGARFRLWFPLGGPESLRS